MKFLEGDEEFCNDFTSMSVDVDVVIIGAGAAGLAAAIELHSSQLTFTVLEARDRIGGRAYTDRETFEPTPVDLGASWIHSYGPRNILYDYFRTLSNPDASDEDISLTLDYDGESVTYDTWRRAARISGEIYEHIEDFTLTANQRDDQSIEQVIAEEYARLVPSEGPVKRFVDLFLSGEEQYDGSNLSDLSAKQWGSGSGSGSDQSISFGYGTLLERIAQIHDLPIQLNTWVTRVDTTDADRVAVITSKDGSTIYCRRVIVTVPLGCLKRETIAFEPALPRWKREAIDEMGMGLMNKLIVQFPTCFWGDQIGSFSHACNKRRGRFRFTMCIPPPANILILFVTGRFAHELEALADDALLIEVLTFLRQVFPRATIPDPIRYRFTRWSQDPFAHGAYSNFIVHAGPHTIEQLGRATANGRVQWAGEHANVNDGTEQWSFGCVHSAFQSGQRAARTLLQQPEVHEK
jgi:monoamine oxidase